MAPRSLSALTRHLSCLLKETPVVVSEYQLEQRPKGWVIATSRRIASLQTIHRAPPHVDHVVHKRARQVPRAKWQATMLLVHFGELQHEHGQSDRSSQSSNFRLFSPDESNSNRWQDALEVTNRAWVADTEPWVTITSRLTGGSWKCLASISARGGSRAIS